MKIITDSGADLSFEDCQQIGVTMVPLKVEVNGVSYQAGVDIETDHFYDLMDASPVMPITSTPSIGDFAELYQKFADEGEEILSIHISSGLSATFNVAKQAAEMVKNAHIHLIDTLTLSAGQAWQVTAAAKMQQAGKSIEEIISKLGQIQAATFILTALFENLFDIGSSFAAALIFVIVGLLDRKGSQLTQAFITGIGKIWILRFENLFHRFKMGLSASQASEFEHLIELYIAFVVSLDFLFQGYILMIRFSPMSYFRLF